MQILFRSKEDNDLKLMKIDAEKQYLETQTKHSMQVDSKLLFSFIFFLISSQLLNFIPYLKMFNIPLYMLIFSGVLFLFFFFISIRNRLNKNKIKKLIEHKEKLTRVISDEIDVNHVTDYLSTIESYIKSIRDTYLSSSTIGFWNRFFDRITKSNQYNPRALICPICYTNNGLSDQKDSIHYICPNCKNHVTATSKYANTAK